jgi:hypothetical protein
MESHNKERIREIVEVLQKYFKISIDYDAINKLKNGKS